MEIQLHFKNRIKRKPHTEYVPWETLCYVKHINMKWYIIQDLEQKHLEPQLPCMGVHS